MIKCIQLLAVQKMIQCFPFCATDIDKSHRVVLPHFPEDQKIKIVFQASEVTAFCDLCNIAKAKKVGSNIIVLNLFYFQPLFITPYFEVFKITMITIRTAATVTLAQ